MQLYLLGLHRLEVAYFKAGLAHDLEVPEWALQVKTTIWKCREPSQASHQVPKRSLVSSHSSLSDRTSSWRSMRIARAIFRLQIIKRIILWGHRLFQKRSAKDRSCALRWCKEIKWKHKKAFPPKISHLVLKPFQTNEWLHLEISLLKSAQVQPLHHKASYQHRDVAHSSAEQRLDVQAHRVLPKITASIPRLTVAQAHTRMQIRRMTCRQWELN